MTSRLAALAAATAIAATGCSADPSADADVEITLVEYAIAISDTPASGPQVLRVENIGHAHHNLSICPTDDGTACTGDPIQHTMLQRPEAARDPSFFDDVGDSLTIGKEWVAVIEIDLEPGTYRFFCGIISHAVRGMQQMVTVEG